ncbi:MAG: hypothetical protein GDA41_04100 [Rhodospirillales bacterium]|nr:hypothetical protein [Rhodospirillales bacterium]
MAQASRPILYAGAKSLTSGANFAITNALTRRGCPGRARVYCAASKKFDPENLRTEVRDGEKISDALAENWG